MSTALTGTHFPYATSHRIDQVGPTLLRKDLSPEALLGDAPVTKTSSEHDPRREPAVYTALLRRAGIGPECVAAGEDWILIERLPAHVLWQVGEPAVWIAVARWLASMHRRLAQLNTDGVPLLRYDTTLAADRADRAQRCGLPRSVFDAHSRAAQLLDELPATLIHGELYPSNVLVGSLESEAWVEGFANSVDVWPIDWELAGIGSALLDVAALTSGWPCAHPTKVAMQRAYFEAAESTSSWQDWSVTLRAAELCICVQWLGWPQWEAPPNQRHDWLGEAIDLARST